MDDNKSSTGSACSCRDPYVGEAANCSVKLVDARCKNQFYDDNKFLCHECIDGAYFGLEHETYNCKFDLEDCTGNDCGTNYYSA